MPKISVQLEADSAEEFMELIEAFKRRDFNRVTAPAFKPYAKHTEPTTPQPEEQQEPEASQGPSEAEGPASIPLEQLRAPKRRGRPAKAAPVEPVEATQPTVGPQPVDAVEEPVPEPVKTKPKTMPHAKPENGAATRQDLLDAFSEYVQRYGASFGFSDISSLLQKNLGDGVRKASDVPEEKLQVAIGAIKTAIADNPFNRKRDYA